MVVCVVINIYLATCRCECYAIKMIIRVAQQTDLLKLSHIWYERNALLQQSDSYFTLLPDAMQVWRDQATDWLVDDAIGFFVAERDGDLIGYIVVEVQDAPIGYAPEQFGRVADIGLDLHQYHSQLGRKLVEQAKSWLNQFEIDYVVIDVSAKYPVEEAFWRTLGARTRSNTLWMKI